MMSILFASCLVQNACLVYHIQDSSWSNYPPFIRRERTYPLLLIFSLKLSIRSSRPTVHYFLLTQFPCRWQTCYRPKSQSPPTRLLPLLPNRNGWRSCWPPSRSDQAAYSPLLTLLLRRLPLHLGSVPRYALDALNFISIPVRNSVLDSLRRHFPVYIG